MNLSRRNTWWINSFWDIHTVHQANTDPFPLIFHRLQFSPLPLLQDRISTFTPFLLLLARESEWGKQRLFSAQGLTQLLAGVNGPFIFLRNIQPTLSMSRRDKSFKGTHHIVGPVNFLKPLYCAIFRVSNSWRFVHYYLFRNNFPFVIISAFFNIAVLFFVPCRMGLYILQPLLQINIMTSPS